MNSPRFLGSKFLFWMTAPWALASALAFYFVAKGSFEDGNRTAGFVTSYFSFLCLLGLFAMVSKKHGLLCGRLIAGTFALGYVWYFASTYFVEGQSLAPSGRGSDSNPFNAICGLVVIGLPCALFAITGRPFWGKKEEPIQPPEPTDPSDDDLT